MRRLLSLILCLSILSTLLCVPASANSATTTDSTNAYVQLSDNTYLIAEDLPNGNAKFSIFSKNVFSNPVF